MAQQWNAPDQQQSERYYIERIRLPADEEELRETLRGLLEERCSRGWRLISVIKGPGGNGLSLEWDTLGSFFR